MITHSTEVPMYLFGFGMSGIDLATNFPPRIEIEEMVKCPACDYVELELVFSNLSRDQYSGC